MKTQEQKDRYNATRRAKRAIFGRKEESDKYRLKNAEKIKIAKAKSYIKNKASVTEKHKEYNKLHKQELSAKSKNYYADNKEKIKHRTREWYTNNKDKVQAARTKYRETKQWLLNMHSRARTAAKNNAKVVWANDFIIKEIYHLAKLRTKLTGVEWHVDHIIPLKSKVVCGFHNEFNLRVIPAIDNLRKGNKLIHNIGWATK